MRRLSISSAFQSSDSSSSDPADEQEDKLELRRIKFPRGPSPAGARKGLNVLVQGGVTGGEAEDDASCRAFRKAGDSSGDALAADGSGMRRLRCAGRMARNEGEGWRKRETPDFDASTSITRVANWSFFFASSISCISRVIVQEQRKPRRISGCKLHSIRSCVLAPVQLSPRFLITLSSAQDVCALETGRNVHSAFRQLLETPLNHIDARTDDASETRQVHPECRIGIDAKLSVEYEIPYFLCSRIRRSIAF